MSFTEDEVHELVLETLPVFEEDLVCAALDFLESEYLGIFLSKQLGSLTVDPVGFPIHQQCRGVVRTL